MLGKYTFWFKATLLFQLITAAAHSMSFFITPEGTNDKERLLIDLMQNYRTDMGMGFSPSTQDIMTAFSACFSLLYLFGALTGGYLLLKKAGPAILIGIINIYLLIFGICFLIMAVFTFLPPAILTGLVFICLVVTRFTIPKL